MSDWQERITRETAPAIRAEHELRYRLAAPLITTSAAWVDLGCGNGIAAAAAIADARPPRVLLVDANADAVRHAAGELRVPDALQIAGDLTDEALLQELGETLRAAEGPAVVTCFEVVEHLATFVPLLEFSGALAREGAATFVLSVPNDAFWSIQNPHHHTSWGVGAFDELRRLLPDEQTLVNQVALSGSAAIGWENAPRRDELTVEVGGEGTVPTHFIAAYGPRHAELWRGALATQVDMLEQRRWERQRENDLAVMQKVAREHDVQVQELDQKILEQQEELQTRTVWFEEWRAYIHELEQELGRALSGVSPKKLPAEEHAAARANAQPGADEGSAPSSDETTEPSP